MNKNIGKIDRLARLLMGIAAIVAVFFVSSLIFKISLFILGALAIIEAAVSRCVIYALLGRNTCPIE